MTGYFCTIQEDKVIGSVRLSLLNRLTFELELLYQYGSWSSEACGVAPPATAAKSDARGCSSVVDLTSTGEFSSSYIAAAVVLGAHVGVRWFCAMSFPRRAVGALLGKRCSDVVALNETVLAPRVSVVSRLFLVAEFLCHKTCKQYCQAVIWNIKLTQMKRAIVRKPITSPKALYTVFHKNSLRYTFDFNHNYGKWRPIFKILSLIYFRENSLCICDRFPPHLNSVTSLPLPCEMENLK